MAGSSGASTVFGFALDSPFPLRTARHGPGDAIEVRVDGDLIPEGGETVMRWTAGAGNPLEATLLSEPAGGYVLDIADSGRYLIRPGEGLICVPPDTPPIRREVRLLGLPLLLCFLERGDLSLHAAAVETPAGAVLIAAPGRHGKTSLAATFTKLGHRLLTEDLCCIRPSDPPALVPGPATLRIRPDMADILPVPDMEGIGNLDERMVLASTSPGTCDPVPVAGVLLLKDFGSELSIDRVDGASALPDLWLLSLHLPTEADRVRKFGQLVDLVARVPTWDVVLPDRVDSLPDTAVSLREVVVG